MSRYIHVNINTIEHVSSQLQEKERLREVSIGLRYGTNANE